MMENPNCETRDAKEPAMQIKKAARTVIIDGEGKFAILEVGEGEYFKIPGGGIEEGEDDQQTAKREALEEAGCDIEIMGEIGSYEFQDSHPQFGITTHNSTCFLAKKIGVAKEVNLTDWEKSKEFKLHWLSFEEAMERFKKAKPKDSFGTEINKRDMEFLAKAHKVLNP